MSSLVDRRGFLSTLLAAPVLGSMSGCRSGLAAMHDVIVVGPDGGVGFELLWRDAPRLQYRATLFGESAIEVSSLGILVDGLDLGVGAVAERTERYELDETFPCRGVHSTGVNRCRGARVFFRHSETNTPFIVEVRVFDDGVAFRHLVPGEGDRVPDEATTFAVPEGSVVWYHDFHGHYEGSHERRMIEDVATLDWAAPPLTLKLPGSRGYASITEGALVDYAGMGLQATGNGAFAARLGHAHPPSYPFTLRFGEEEAARLSRPASISGPITTPWRVIMIGQTLNALVNCDILQSVSAPPDPAIFPDGIETEWLRPGRAVWKYLDGGENTLEEMRRFSRLAGELGFEHHVVEGFWREWTEAELHAFVEESRSQGVGVWLWQHSRNLHDRAERMAFFRRCREAGVAGVKLDFFDHEAKELIDLYQDCLRDAAANRLMVNFHGANKPTGEARTWPNEMNREAISGMERRSMSAWSRHNATLPFTRMLAGHADFTPMLFGERKRETSWPHQIASAAVLSAPVLVLGAHPQSIVENPAVEVIRNIPSVWDETRVLPPSEIGEVAVFARRSGRDWFLAVLNGPDARDIEIPLSFLTEERYGAVIVRDRAEDAAAVDLSRSTATKSDRFSIDLRAGGGFVALLRPA